MASPYVVPRIPAVDAVAADERAATFGKRSIKTDAKVAGLKLAISMTDLTTLAGADTPGKVRSLCRKARSPMLGRDDIPTTAAVCVYPPFVAQAKRELEGTDVKVAAVATYFPSGQASLGERLEEVKRTVGEGADEIDMVINRGAFLAGRDQEVFEEIVAVKEACGKARLKVILETGELGTLDNVAAASRLALAAGPDFIKTSTGKISPAATMEVTLVMLEAIREHYLDTGEQIGMKPAGGIRTAKQALHYLVMLAETLGKGWMSPEWFRFGASSLVNDLLHQIARRGDGHYASPRRFSVD